MGLKGLLSEGKSVRWHWFDDDDVGIDFFYERFYWFFWE
jgi:hypothetical protein